MTQAPGWNRIPRGASGPRTGSTPVVRSPDQSALGACPFDTGRCRRATGWAAALLAAGVLLPLSLQASGNDPSQAGAYCPLPELGQVPQCLAPAKAEFGDFFAAVEAGGVEDSQSRRLEAALASGSTGDESYLALSSLAYGYFKLAQRAAADPSSRPELAARLDRWNAVLLKAYSDSESNPEFQQAVRLAARDLDTKAPAIAPGGGLLQLISQADGRSSGMRGALEGLMGRILGEDTGP